MPGPDPGVIGVRSDRGPTPFPPESGLGGKLIDMGEGSLLTYFGTLIVVSALVFAAPLVIDRHVPPARVRFAVA